MRQQRYKKKYQQNDRKDSENNARNALRIHRRTLHEWPSDDERAMQNNFPPTYRIDSLLTLDQRVEVPAH